MEVVFLLVGLSGFSVLLVLDAAVGESLDGGCLLGESVGLFIWL